MSEKEKAVALFGGATAVAQTAGGLKQLANETRGAGGAMHLKLSKQGEWLFGPEDIGVDASDRWAINPASFMTGVIGWRDGNVVDEIMYSLSSGGSVNWDDLPSIPAGDGNGWKEQVSLGMRNLEEDIQLQYGATSLGGRNAIAALAGQIGERLETNPESPVAVVELHVDSYKHKKYGKIYTPDIRVVGWVDPMGQPAEEKRNLTA